MSEAALAQASLAQSGPFGALSDYDRRNLFHHLIAADQSAHLHTLLAWDGAGGGNAWYELRRDHDEITALVADLVLARRSALQQGNAAVPLAIRYALMAASISSQAGAVAPELLDAMVQAQVLSLEHALTIAREIPNPAQRAVGLALFSRHPDAPKGLETEALNARDHVVDRWPSPGRIEVDAQLLRILPLSVPAPKLASQPSRDFFGRRPPLRKLFARRFLEMPPCEHPMVADIFKHADPVAATRLLALIGLAPQQQRLQRKKIGLKILQTRPGWELDRLQGVMHRPPGAEEVVAALIGLVEAAVPILQNPEQLALEAVRRIGDRDDKFLFLSVLAHVAHDPAPIVAEVRSLLEAGSAYTYAAAAAAVAIIRRIPHGEQSEFRMKAIAITLVYTLAHADRFRLQAFGEAIEHRTVLLARAVAPFSRSEQFVLSICAEHCGVDEDSHDVEKRDAFAYWLRQVVKAGLAQAGGEAAEDPGPWRGGDRLTTLERGRNLAAVLACVPRPMQRERLRAEYARLTAALEDQPIVTAFAATLATLLPRGEGLGVLRDLSVRATDRKVLADAIASLAPDFEGLELLNSLDPDIVTLELLRKLPLTSLLQLKDRAKAHSHDSHRNELLTSIAIAAFRCHGQDLFEDAIRHLTGAEMYSWTAEQVVRIAGVAPRGYGPRLEALAASLRTPNKWDPVETAGSIASERARMWGALARRDDVADRDEMMRRCLRTLRQSFDHVRAETLQLVAPALTAAHVRDADRVVGSMEKYDSKLEALLALVGHAPDAIAKRYAGKMFRSLMLRRIIGIGISSPRIVASAVHMLMPRLGIWRLRVLDRVMRGALGSDELTIETRLAELGCWQEALERIRAKYFRKPDEYIGILPYIPVGERAPVLDELLALETRKIELSHCAALRPYMEEQRWLEMVLDCVRDALTSHEARASNSDKPQLLGAGAEELLRTLPFDRLWDLVTELGLDDRSRAVLLQDISIILPALSANGRIDELTDIQRAVEDVVRWWPPEVETKTERAEKEIAA